MALPTDSAAAAHLEALTRSVDELMEVVKLLVSATQGATAHEEPGRLDLNEAFERLRAETQVRTERSNDTAEEEIRRADEARIRIAFAQACFYLGQFKALWAAVEEIVQLQQRLARVESHVPSEVGSLAEGQWKRKADPMAEKVAELEVRIREVGCDYQLHDLLECLSSPESADS